MNQLKTWNLEKTIESPERRVFLIVLVVIAILVNGFHIVVSAQHRDAELLELERKGAARKAADETAAHRKDLERYFNVAITRKPGMKTVAIAVASENGKLNRTVADTIAGRLKSGTTETLTTFFAPEFVSDGLFAQMYSDSTKVYGNPDLKNALDAVVLAKQTVEYTQDASLENVISAHMLLEVTAISVAARGDSQTWTFTANGAGFKRDDARSLAEERLIKQLTDGKKISLNGIPSGNH